MVHLLRFLVSYLVQNEKFLKTSDSKTNLVLILVNIGSLSISSWVSFPLSLSQSFSVFLNLSQSLDFVNIGSLNISYWASSSVSLSFSILVSISRSRSLSISLSQSLSFSISLWRSFQLSLSISLTLSLSLNLSVSLCKCDDNLAATSWYFCISMLMKVYSSNHMMIKEISVKALFLNSVCWRIIIRRSGLKFIADFRGQ